MMANQCVSERKKAQNFIRNEGGHYRKSVLGPPLIPLLLGLYRVVKQHEKRGFFRGLLVLQQIPIFRCFSAIFIWPHTVNSELYHQKFYQ